MEALYRKYRPGKFSEVIGQAHVKTILQNALTAGRISHAYLFCGPRGVGKTTVARIFAKAVNCTAQEAGEPDTVCPNCRAQQEGRFLDLLEIDAASYTGVENIREIIDHVKFAPNSGKYKIFIVDEVHMLSKAAFNALLKTLEEPPRHAIFILATTEIHKVPATIVSRTQRFDFKAVSVPEILELYEVVAADMQFVVSPEARRLMAVSAAGSFRDALSILDQMSSLAGPEISLSQVEEVLGLTRTEVLQKFFDHLAAGDQTAAMKLVKDLALAGRDLVQFTRNFLEYMRLLLLLRARALTAAEIGLAPEDELRLQSQAQNVPSARVLAMVKSILEAHRQTKLSPVAELPLLAAIAEFAPTAGQPEARANSEKPDAATDLSTGQILEQWAEVLTRVKNYNQSLLSSLRLGRVVGLAGRDLTLAFPYNFHKEMIDARKNRIVVEQALSEVFKQSIRVVAALERDMTPESGDLVGEALKILGK